MQIRGIYQKTLYRNEKTLRTVFSLRLVELVENYDWMDIICIGSVYASCIGMPMKLTGELKTDKGFDKPSFCFENLELLSSNEEEINALPAFKGIPQTTIKELTDKFGINIFKWNTNPNLFSELTEIDGIGPTRAKNIFNTVNYYEKYKDFYSYVANYGESPIIKSSFSSATLLEDSKLLSIFLSNPYIFGRKCSLTFKCCDAIARDNGFKANDRKRIAALVREALDTSFSKGFSCLPLDRTLKGVQYINKRISVFPEEKISLNAVLAELLNSPDIVSFKDKNKKTYFYIEPSYENERLLANNVIRLQTLKRSFNVDVKKAIKKAEKQIGIEYNENQKESFKFLESSGIKILTGGPGTGKTTVINGIIHAYETLFPDNKIVLMAPTGRAAQRMSEVTGRDAGTIHRMFGLKSLSVVGELEKAVISSDYTGNYPADLIVIDEASMLDNELAAYALYSIKGGATVILVGDINQLPSVGAGNVLTSLINSNIIDTVRLEVNYRQGDISTIAENAEKIKNGEVDLKTDDSFIIHKISDKKKLEKEVEKVFQKEFKKEEPFKTQILCAVKEGPLGVRKFNSAIQKLINSSPSLLEAKKYEYKIGDKVIITENNYEDFCFNGDLGIITDLLDEKITINLMSTAADGEREVTYSKDRYEEVELAYAMSIHKSQGSEYDTVIICLPEETSAMLRRRLLYTAVTRAKKKVYIFYMGNALEKAILNNNDKKRISCLTEMLTEI